jgi:hypothetical protein
MFQMPLYCFRAAKLLGIFQKFTLNQNKTKNKKKAIVANQVQILIENRLSREFKKDRTIK